MIAWRAFTHNEIEYDLSHLHPVTLQYVQPEKGECPARMYSVGVAYSLHCFTTKKRDSAPSPLDYSDSRETRSFDFERYELSKNLPSIIQGLNLRKCMHTCKGNYFLVEILTRAGEKKNYEVYFEVNRHPHPGQAGVAYLFVQSAYVRDPKHTNRPPPTKKIGLYVILHNTLAGKPIRAPQ